MSALSFFKLPSISPSLGLTISFAMASTRTPPKQSSNSLDSDSINSITRDHGTDVKDLSDAPIIVENLKVREHTDAVSDEKVAFLDTFTPEEEKRIMRKVDWKILPLIGLMMLVKSVSILFN